MYLQDESGSVQQITDPNINYDQITFRTISNEDGVYTLIVVVNYQLALCQNSNNCSYTFIGSIAPVVTNVSPGNVSEATNVTMTGYNFGSNAASVQVQIGNNNCTVLSVDNNTIVCTLDALDLGPQPFIINLEGT